MNEFISLKDCNGKFVFIREVDLYEAMARQGFTLFGMSMDVIIEFLTQYEIKNGPMPPTVESVALSYNTKVNPAGVASQVSGANEG